MDSRVYENPEEMADAIKRALKTFGVSQIALAKGLGVSRQTVRRMIEGKPGSLGDTPKKRWALSLAIVEVTGAPRDWFGLEPAPLSALAVVQRQVDLLRTEIASIRRDVASVLLEQGQAEVRGRSGSKAPRPGESSGEETGNG